ncbi:MAG TPA: hypothetical protein VFV07_11165 [Rhizomicrobium sp.]|nr:hypothetical protein [Rhizomicrobium sp.]
MQRKADAIVTGFAKSRELAELSLVPLLRLRQENVLRRVVCVTWDTPEIDAYAGWVENLPGVTLARVPQPQTSGTGNQRGIVYQTESLRAALSLLPQDGEVTLKSRPDYVFDTAFLRRKIAAFDSWSTTPPRAIFGVVMPKPVLQSRIWIPWADSNQPFYYEDAAFIGARRDLHRLVTQLTAQDVATLGDETCGSFVHAVRYAKPFLGDYPLFQRYLREYRYFASALEYRRKLVQHIVNDGFFWHMLIAHAWILHSHFHVDAGEQGELRFYSNNANRDVDADWTDPAALNLANPYDHLQQWRAWSRPGQAYPGIYRPYGRLLDDAWQRAFFTAELSDFPRATLVRILQNVASCRDGRLEKIEDDFYRGLADFHRVHGPKPPVAEAC